MVVLPFVALCSEKADHLERILQPINREVKRLYGRFSDRGNLFTSTTGAIICTIEKASDSPVTLSHFILATFFPHP